MMSSLCVSKGEVEKESVDLDDYNSPCSGQTEILNMVSAGEAGYVDLARCISGSQEGQQMGFRRHLSCQGHKWRK